MNEKDDALLRDILEHAEEAQQFLAGVTMVQFRKNRQLRLATERLLEIVGEAAGALTEETRASIRIDWRGIRGLRNVIAHQYGSIDSDQLYRVVTLRFPEILPHIQEALR